MARSISFLGAAKTVTGSMHLLNLPDGGLLVDCGLFQGRRKEAFERNRNLPKPALGARAVLLTHAHIDHSGNLPSLVRQGFRGPIHCTAATADLCQAMLKDSGRIQESDAAWINKRHRKDPDWQPVEPLYTEEDAQQALNQLEPHPYEETFEPLPGVTAHFLDAGHVLGSASAVLDLPAAGAEPALRVAFSGDIGRRNLPILRDPTPPGKARFVVMESTYGNRLHADASNMQRQLREVIERTRQRGGKVIIPSFALERTQEIVYALNKLVTTGEIAPIPVYVDSPLAVSLTEVFRRNEQCYDAETAIFDDDHGDPFGFDRLELVRSVERSKQLNTLAEPAVIISASGMCEGGRIIHHLRNNVEDPRNSIVIVGYQAQHTLGRRIVEKREEIRIFGARRKLRSEVVVLNAFSAHADRDELLWWAEQCGPQVERYFLVHGDEDQAVALAGHLEQRGARGYVPSMGETVSL